VLINRRHELLGFSFNCKNMKISTNTKRKTRFYSFFHEETVGLHFVQSVEFAVCGSEIQSPNKWPAICGSPMWKSVRALL